MSNNKIGKENKLKKRCQPLLTFQTYNPGYQTKNVIYGKNTMPNP